MTQGEAEKFIDEAAINGAGWVSFTGGEPFLFTQLLEESVSYATSLGIFTEVVTNAFWADTFTVGVRILKPLVDNGLDVLNISVDDFHQEYIPLENIRNAFESARETGLKTVFMITLRKKSKITSLYLKELLHEYSLQKIGDPKIAYPDALILESPFVPVGGGETISHEAVQGESTPGPCGDILRDIAVRPDGTVLPCCGPLGLIEDAALGNLKKESLSSMLDRAWQKQEYASLREKILGSKHQTRCNDCITRFKSTLRDRPIFKSEILF